MSVIYGLFEPLTGELRYVGQTRQDSRRRLYAHRSAAKHGGNQKVAEWVRCLDPIVPVVRILEVVQPDDLNSAEARWIAESRSEGCDLLNVATGHAATGYHHTAEARERIGSASRGKPLSDEHKLKLSKATKGRVLASPEGIKRGADKKRGRKQSPEWVKKRAASNRGQKRSKESLERMSEAQKGIPKANPHNFRRVSCSCGLITNPGALAGHVKASGHERAT